MIKNPKKDTSLKGKLNSLFRRKQSNEFEAFKGGGNGNGPKVLSDKELRSKYVQLTQEQQEHISDLIAEQLNENLRPEPNLSHRAIGRLVFEYDRTDGEMKPLHHMLVELWDRDIGSPDDLLATGETDANGNFEIWYDPADAGLMDLPDLDLRIYEPTHTFHNDGTVKEGKRLVHVITGDDDVTTQTYDFGTCRVPYWEYDPDAITPRVLIMEQGNPPQSYDAGRSVSLVKAAARVEATRRKHKLQYKMAPNKLTINKIQKDYPESLTVKLDKERPGYSRSDEFFGERFLNGMTASILEKDLDNPDRYRIVYRWNAYEQDGIHACPNIDIRFEVVEDQLLPVEIHIGLRDKGVTVANAPAQKHVFTPADGERWEQAKRIARAGAAFSAELDSHLVVTHLNTEQYAIAAHRNLRKNPIRLLLYPHLRDVTLVNHSANGFLIGDDGHITRAVGLTPDALVQRIGHTLGTQDWRNWRPRTPLTQNHTYAYAINLYWELLTEYVDHFFDNYLDEIKAHWKEIRMFSDDLVAHSVPQFSCSYMHRHARPGSASMQKVPGWYNQSERADLAPTSADSGVQKAVSPITQTDVPGEGDIENVKQVCRYIIIHATLMHDWPNSKQYDDGGEVIHTSLGLRYGEDGPFKPEDDLSIAPHPLVASEQLFISYMLSAGSYGYVIKNENRDIHPAFITLLRQNAEAFAKVGVDINSIQSRINI